MKRSLHQREKEDRAELFGQVKYSVPFTAFHTLPPPLSLSLSLSLWI